MESHGESERLGAAHDHRQHGVALGGRQVPECYPRPWRYARDALEVHVSRVAERARAASLEPQVQGAGDGICHVSDREILPCGNAWDGHSGSLTAHSAQHRKSVH